MDANSSGEELVIKTRKPYTLTKQRERWTEEEHNRFLEALKLYGRAWQRIEEHIGTKTAVQIRSHAQKFFFKLEKEAQAKGIPVCQTLDIEIPPPRPKRKPSNPYPRKMGNSTPNLLMGVKHTKISTSVSSLNCKKALHFERISLSENPRGDNVPSKENENQGEDCSEVLSLLPEVRSSSVSSVNKSSSAPIIVASQDNGTKMAPNAENPGILHGKSVQGLENDVENGIVHDQGMKFPRHIPFHAPDGIFQGSICHAFVEAQEQPNILRNPAAANAQNHTDALRASHQAFQAFHRAFAPVHHAQDDYQSFSNASSTFSNLIIATLLQNPAVHAAASFAATCWPYANMDGLAESQMNNQGGYPPSQMSMAAIAAATVAAAMAWWAAQGLLPFCAPFSSCFDCGPQGMSAAPSDGGHAPAAEIDAKEIAHQNADQYSSSKSASSSSSESEESGSTKLKDALETTNHEDAATVTKLNDENKAKNGKQIDRSSCGSNTPSSSDIETDALEKHEKGNDEQKDAEASHQASESTNRRSRSSNNGRLAFQALFAREVLPQSFSPPYDQKNKGNQKDDSHKQKVSPEKKQSDLSELDLNSQKKCGPEVEMKQTAVAENNDQEGLLTIGLSQVKFKARKNGFKPYKRCSVEAKENGVTTPTSKADEKVPKRIRLESEAST